MSRQGSWTKGYGNSVINPDGTQSGGSDLRMGTSLVTSVQDPYIGLGFVPNGYCA